MACDGDFCNDFMLLNPQEASFLDLIWLLFSPEIEERRFIKCPEKLRQDFRRRWLIFISVVAQKLLVACRKPMAYLGYVLEMWLNLVSINGGGFLMFLLNLLKGKVVKPKKSSATFRSVVGHADNRVELDRNIKPDDRKYNAALAIMAAKLSYESEIFIKNTVTDLWKMEFLGFHNFWNDYQQRSSTQAFVLQDTRADPNLIVVAFRGTDPFNADAWSTDVDISWYALENLGRIHGGFMKALGLQKQQGWPKKIDLSRDKPQFAYYSIRELLRDLLPKNEKAKFILTGHSLGGALAILYAAVLALHEEEWLLQRLEGVYTFGQPRVGDKQFGEFMEENLIKYDVKYLRFVYCNDMVPRLPYDDKTVLFKHFGPCLYFNSCYKGKIEKEEPNKNYFSLLWVIPKSLNAVWELVRGCFIPFAKGSEYREGWFLRTLRLIGLVIPGLSAHFPQDYVNTTRLGSLPLPLQLRDRTNQHEPKKIS